MELTQKETPAAAKGKEVTVETKHIPIKGRRRNLGRQARKRRKKYLEVEAAAAAFITERTSEETTQDSTILPTDRSYVLEDVRKRTVLSETDRRNLIRQLGYLPGNALEVVARIEDAFSSSDMERLFAAAAVVVQSPTKQRGVDETGNSNEDDTETVAKEATTATTTPPKRIQEMMKEPLVVKLYPLALRDESSSTKRRRKRRRDENEDPAIATATHESTTTESLPLMEPFPTIYWVTHPLIKALISKLELDRLNVRFEKVLASEPNNKNDHGCSPLESMKSAHNSYGRERRELLSSKDMEYVKGRGWYNSEDNDNNGDASSSCSKKPSTAPFGDGCGVAGIRNPGAVKCLHAHAAHYWSGNSENVVGQWVSKELKQSGRSFFRE